MIYPGGQPLPKNVFEALKFTGKVGFISRSIWNRFFAVGTTRWSRRQFQSLIDKKLLIQHPNKVAMDYFILTPLSRQLLHSQKCIHVEPTHMIQICHDETVATSILQLYQEGLVIDWKCEAELKKTREFQLNENVRDQKYPDAIMKVSVSGKERTLAIEYERTQKSSTRYKDILWLYSSRSNLGMVLFICESSTIEKTIEGRMKYLGIPELFHRVAFVSSLDWTTNPSEARIRYGDKVISLKKICSPITIAA